MNGSLLVDHGTIGVFPGLDVSYWTLCSETLLLDTGWPSVRNHTLSAVVTMKIERAETKGTMDRRVARTRALLQDALIALIPELGYAAITVEDICEKADVGRSTFYTHYAGKDDLRSATIDA